MNPPIPPTETNLTSSSSQSAESEPNNTAQTINDSSFDRAFINVTDTNFAHPVSGPIEKPPPNIGIYIIAIASILASVVGFITATQYSVIYIILTLINIGLAIGLIFKANLARKIVVWLAVITIAIAMGYVLLLVNAQNNLKKDKANYETSVGKIYQKLSPIQKQKIDTLNKAFAVEDKKVKSEVSLAYIKLFITIGVELVVIIYLSRQSVKKVFES